MEKIISAPDYALYLAIGQEFKENSSFKEISENVYYCEGDGITLTYFPAQKNSFGFVKLHSDSEEDLSKFEKKILDLINGKK
jgi:hypothetical protein